MTKEKNSKYDRLSLALRQNLSRRKEQKRSRSQHEESIILETTTEGIVSPDHQEQRDIPSSLEDKN